ncbi:putative DNA modification/repair radical SAM protein [bacterium 210820-DFI.6.37]|nr:putative DNA modification/repair radical SAM protein [bacterium 210820-DFI.6.37]
MDLRLDKLKILADSAKYDVSCSSSGVGRRNNGRIGSGAQEGICHTWSADGRCISLLKVLFTNKCAYDCEYCVNRRSADTRRASFEPEELARLTIEFYRRNYIEGLFLSSAVEVSPDHTAERILRCLRILRREYGFAGYIHAKIIPGVSQELVHAIGMEADRLSVNIEMPTSKSLSLFAPQKKPKQIFSPMRQITNTLIERKALKGPGTMFKGQDINSPLNYLNPGQTRLFAEPGQIRENQNARGAGVAGLPEISGRKKETFAPAGQTTQMIIGAGKESDRQILTTTENLYHTFKMKRVYYSAYIPAVSSPILPDALTAPPLGREHRLYQADWLLRFYGFSASELLDEENPNLDPDLDPKVTWALRHLDQFPVEVNKAPMDLLLRIPGVGVMSARRILRQRKVASVKYDDLKKMGVVLKRAKHFLTCGGKFYGEMNFTPDVIKNQILQINDGIQMSMFGASSGMLTAGKEERGKTLSHG